MTYLLIEWNEIDSRREWGCIKVRVAFREIQGRLFLWFFTLKRRNLHKKYTKLTQIYVKKYTKEQR